MSKVLVDPAVLDERAEFEKAGERLGIEKRHLTTREWWLWQARAALSQQAEPVEPAPAQTEQQPVARVAGNEIERYLRWEDGVAAFDLEIGAKLYAAPIAQTAPAQDEREFAVELTKKVHRALGLSDSYLNVRDSGNGFERFKYDDTQRAYETIFNALATRPAQTEQPEQQPILAVKVEADCVEHVHPEYGGGYFFTEGAIVEMYAAPIAQTDPWQPSGADYDRAIHDNPDAKAWADLFVDTFPGLKDKHGLMIGWFANAMMAMHDHLARKTAPQPEQSALAEIADLLDCARFDESEDYEKAGEIIHRLRAVPAPQPGLYSIPCRKYPGAADQVPYCRSDCNCSGATTQPEQGGLSDPRQWTDQQVLDFLGVALRNVDVVGTVHLSEIRQGFELVMGRPAMPDQGGARE